jgi:mannose-1-phosphate guanylyltransferase / mannose-6-phosphate isomerase
MRAKPSPGQERKPLVVVLAGGSGTRFWPLSRELYPKQVLRLAGQETLIQQTVQRMKGLVPLDQIYIVTNARHLDEIKLQLAPIDPRFKERFISEPEARNTAAAIGLAALMLGKLHPNSMMVVVSADHVIRKPQTFFKAIRQAIPAAEEGRLVTFGIKPHRPDTGYGYFKIGKRLSSNHAYKVSRFVEKPRLETARQYLKQGDYYWNSGIFVWRTSVILEEIKARLPRLYQGLIEIKKAFDASNEQAVIQSVYQKLPSISIDHGVLSHSNRTAAVLTDFGWTDVGSWAALGELKERRDKRRNVIAGNVLDLESRDSVIYADQRLVATIGLEKMVVVDTADATLVCPKENAQDIKRIVEQLKQRQAKEQQIHTTVNRPWGSYTVLEEGNGYKIKRIVVKPGTRLSLQMHHKRSEHWVVVSGVAQVTCGNRVYDVKSNESTFIPMGTKHRLANPGKEPLQIIEVQNGDYVGEDDIVRFEDDYERVPRA